MSWNSDATAKFVKVERQQIGAIQGVLCALVGASSPVHAKEHLSLAVVPLTV